MRHILPLIVLIFLISTSYSMLYGEKDYDPNNLACEKVYSTVILDCHKHTVNIYVRYEDGSYANEGMVYLLQGSLIDKSEINNGVARLHYFGKNKLITHPYDISIQIPNHCIKVINYGLEECKENENAIITLIEEMPPGETIDNKMNNTENESDENGLSINESNKTNESESYEDMGNLSNSISDNEINGSNSENKEDKTANKSIIDIIIDWILSLFR